MHKWEEGWRGAVRVEYCDFRNYRQHAQLIQNTLKIHFKMRNSQNCDKINQLDLLTIITEITVTERGFLG